MRLTDANYFAHKATIDQGALHITGKFEVNRKDADLGQESDSHGGCNEFTCHPGGQADQPCDIQIFAREDRRQFA